MSFERLLFNFFTPKSKRLSRVNVIKKTKILFMTTIAVMTLSGCSTAYYNTLEKFGVHKRDILVDRVEEARDSQEEAKEQFNSALEQFGSVVKYDGGDLQTQYNKLDKEYQSSVAISEEVTSRINAIERVSEDLFDEWSDELDRYSNQKLRQQSEAKLKSTQKEYKTLIKAMRSAENKMAPVLEVFEDQVLFLKHNLNAQALTAIQSEYVSIESDVEQLIREMQNSINEANAFIAQLE